MNQTWNKARQVGAKPALLPRHIQAIRLVLEEKAPLRDQCLFALAIDSSLRGCDLVRLQTHEIYNGGAIRDRVRIQTSKTDATIVFEPTPATKKLCLAYITEQHLPLEGSLFTREDRAAKNLIFKQPMTTRAYRMLVKKWVQLAGLDPAKYGTHSLRRARPAHIYAQTGNLRACQIMLGHSTIAMTQRYLGVEEEETLEIVRNNPL